MTHPNVVDTCPSKYKLFLLCYTSQFSLWWGMSVSIQYDWWLFLADIIQIYFVDMGQRQYPSVFIFVIMRQYRLGSLWWHYESTHVRIQLDVAEQKDSNVVDGWSILVQKSFFVLESHYHLISVSWCHMSVSSINIMGRCPSSINFLLVVLNIHPHVMYSYHGSIPIQAVFGIVSCQCTSKFAIPLTWLNSHVNSFVVVPDTYPSEFRLLTAMGH